MGTAVGSLSIAHDFNISQAINQVENNLEEVISNIASAAKTYVNQYLETLGGDIGQDLMSLWKDDSLTWAEHPFPTFNYTFELGNL